LINQDRRIRRTQQLLAHALISLTLERSYESVTIRDITERADVGYATFFRHYKDKNELLKDVLDVVLEELIVLLSSENTNADPQMIGTYLFHYVQTHSEVVRILVSNHEMLQHVINKATQRVMLMYNDPPDSPVPLEITVHHIISSSIALTEWWVSHQMSYSPEQMGRIYYQLLVLPTNHLMLPKQKIAK
jgi:AcrR family transcriptional regulator